ncbi:MAG: NAD(P)/FAD-dependent oxidoreductase [Nitrososphaerales archaeon]
MSSLLPWETKRPYLYMRNKEDGRIMVGGEDEYFVNPTWRDDLIQNKAAMLRKIREMFPKLDLELGYAWAGTFGETEDSLPHISEVNGYSNAYFALCYGTKGTNFAVIASEIICDMYLVSRLDRLPSFSQAHNASQKLDNLARSGTRKIKSECSVV